MIARVDTELLQPLLIDLPLRGVLIRALQLGMGWFPEQPGGLDRYYRELLERLPAARVAVRGLVCGSNVCERQSRGAVRTASNSDVNLPRRLMAFSHAVKRECREFRPDVVVTHFALYAWPVLRKLRNRPLVVHFHGPWYAESHAEGQTKLNCWAKFRVEQAVYRRADRLITLSNTFKDFLVREFGVDEGRVRVIRGGVDVRRFDIAQSKCEARAALGWPQDRPIILTVRRLLRRMGLENLIEAAATLRNKHPDALILIAGEGRLRKELTARIEAANLHNHVRLLGYLPDEQLPLAYRAADLTVVPSIALEGFGLVAVESLAAGTPAIVTPVGGLPEIVQPLGANLLTRDTSTPALIEAIDNALANESSLPDSAECLRHANRFDWSANLPAIRDVLNGAIRG